MNENRNSHDHNMTATQKESQAALARARERARHNQHPLAGEMADRSQHALPRTSVPPFEPVTVNGHQIRLEPRVDIHVYFVEERLGVEVHLGEEFEGEWYPHVLGTASGCPEMSDDEVADFMTGEEALAEPMIEDHDEAVRLVTATRDRCLRLAVAKAKLEYGGSAGKTAQPPKN